MDTGTLAVPGADLHHEVRGRGPALLLINGGDAAMYGLLAPLLADHHTVITYDARGNSRSPLTGPPREQRIEEHTRELGVPLPAEPSGEMPARVQANVEVSLAYELRSFHPDGFAEVMCGVLHP
ncbi:hypothetical protein ABZ297_46240 [Nonomuraea sp. NPDC005983]|uniref:alpha/beta fold hydrolase n=1 Tax=Nonomuraea sp. NPDC005983 TaxID=3155595 RepID=UPI0033BDEC85